MFIIFQGCILTDEQQLLNGTAVPLIDHTQWERVASAEDPWLAHFPENISCTNSSYYGEEGSLEIDTNDCNYLALAQPSLSPLESSDVVEVIAWHGWLFPEEAEDTESTAHLLLEIGGVILWDQDILMPAEPDTFSILWAPPHSFPNGETIYFHIHNHGSNTYNLLSVEIVP